MFGSIKTKKKGNVGLSMQVLEDRTVPTIVLGTPTQPYSVQAGHVLTVPATNGVLAYDYSTDDPNAILAASVTQGAEYSGANAPALPAGTLTFTANGAFTIVAPSNYVTNYGNITFQYQAIDTLTGEQSQVATVTIKILAASQEQKLYATGSGPGVAAEVKVYNASTGLLLYDLFPYESSFTGGVHVATGDLTGDGTDDIVVAPANGGGPRVEVYDGATGILLEDFMAVDPNFRGGANVAIGDILGNGVNDLIVGAGVGGGPRVVVYNGADINTVPIGTNGATSTFSSSIIANFFAYESTFRGGVEVAAGDIDGTSQGVENERDFIVTAPGDGGAPLIKEFDATMLNNGYATPTPVLSFFAGDVNDRSGASVAVGQFRGDNDAGQNEADIVVGAGSGAPVVTVYDGRSGAELRSFTVSTADEPVGGVSGTIGEDDSGSVSNFSGTSTGGGLVTGELGSYNSGGVDVAVIDRNGDGLSDIVTAVGAGNAPIVRIYDGNTLTSIDSFTAYPSNFLGGVFVGGNSLLTS